MSTKNNHVKIKTWLMEGKRRTKLIRIQNPGGHKEGRASFPIQSQYKVSKIHTLNPTPREGREEEQREGREGAREKSWLHSGRQAKRERERRGSEGVFIVPMQGSKIPLDLN